MQRELELQVPGSGPVSAILLQPDPQAALLVLGHGAGAGMRHASLESIARALLARGIGTLRYQFPYMEAGRARTDRPEVAVATVRAAVAEGARQAGSAPLLAGGHSFGGRMTTLAASGSELPVQGLVLCSFPLHLPGKPAITRAAALAAIPQPILFLSGDRDAMAERELLSGVVSELGPRARLHWLETADHGYKVLKRTRRSAESVFDEIARVTREFADAVASRTHAQA